MRNFLTLFLVLIISFITACTQTEESLSENETPKEEPQKITTTSNGNEKQIVESVQNVDVDEVDEEVLSLISNLSGQFIEAHTTGDLKTLKTLLADDMSLLVKDNKLYVQNIGDDFEWFLYDSQSEITFDHWELQGYDYDNEEGTFLVHIREFYSDINGEPVSPPTFLNLIFKIQKEWEIISVVFDV